MVAMGAGGSAQAEYERRNARDRDRRRRSRKRRVLLLVLTPFFTYGLIRFGVLMINEQIVPSMIDSVGAPGGEPAAAPPEVDPPIPPETAHLIGLAFAVLVTGRMAISLWGPRAATEAWRKGAEGERATGRALDALPDGYTVRHDVRMPGSRANIDHLVFGPTGVFTVETKNYAKGVTIRGGKARSSGRSMDGAISQARGQAEAMRRVLDVDVRPLICVQGGPIDVGWFGRPVVGGVRFVSGRHLVKAIRSGKRVFSESEIAALLSPATAPARRPTAPTALQSAGDVEPCSCGAPRVLRHRKRDGQAFWACSTFPRCRVTAPT